MDAASKAYYRFERIREEVGDDNLFEAIAQYLNTDALNELCESLEDDFDLLYFRGCSYE